MVRNILRTQKVHVDDIVRFDFEPNPLTLKRNESMVLVLRSGRRVMVTGLTLPTPAFFQRRGRARCAGMNAELEKRKAS